MSWAEILSIFVMLPLGFVLGALAAGAFLWLAQRFAFSELQRQRNAVGLDVKAKDNVELGMAMQDAMAMWNEKVPPAQIAAQLALKYPRVAMKYAKKIEAMMKGFGGGA